VTGAIASASSPNWINRLLGWPGVATAFVWGLAEGTFFFLIPDIVITLAALFAPKGSLRHVAAVVVGALVAGLLMFTWAERDPTAARLAVGKVPFVRHAMFDKVEHDFNEVGVWAMCKGPFSGIPYKIYAVEAAGRVSLASFLLVTIPARLERLLITWALFAVAGMLLKPRLPSRMRIALAGYAIYWICLYAYYWTSVSR
jgi:hypothetical protein